MSIGFTIFTIIMFLGGVAVGVLLSNFKEPDGVVNVIWHDDKCVWDIQMDEEKFEEKVANGSIARLKFTEEKDK